MEKELSNPTWNEVRRWAWIVGVNSLFGLMYYWALVYATINTHLGNLVLALAAALWVGIMWASFAATNEFYGRRKWSYRGYGRIVSLVFVIVIVSHIVGYNMPTTQLQLYFAFAPAVLFFASCFALIVFAWFKAWSRRNDNREEKSYN